MDELVDFAYMLALECGLLLPCPETHAQRMARLGDEARILSETNRWAVGACGLLSDAERRAAMDLEGAA